MNAIRRFVKHPLTVRICQISIGVVFIAAALPKIGDMQSFATQIHNYRLIPVPVENLLAMTLPWVELVVGVALIVGQQARAGAWVTAVLMVVFLVAIGQAVARGLDIECGCFGTGDATRVGFRRLGEDVVLLALAAVGTFRAR